MSSDLELAFVLVMVRRAAPHLGDESMAAWTPDDNAMSNA